MYHARLWFKDETTGAENVGAVPVAPGDAIWCTYSFHRDAGDTTSRWTTLQMFIDIDAPGPNSILTDDDANTWDAAIGGRYGIPQDFPIAVAWDPADGPIHDNGIDPADSTLPVVTYKGVYGLVGVNGSKVQSHDIDNLGFFTFHVGAQAIPGAELHWGLEGRNTDAGITTRIYDNKNHNVKVTDNWLTVVPEPSSLAMVGIGLLALGRLLRRRGESP